MPSAVRAAASASNFVPCALTRSLVANAIGSFFIVFPTLRIRLRKCTPTNGPFRPTRRQLALGSGLLGSMAVHDPGSYGTPALQEIRRSLPSREVVLP